jgi:hypothetical protein
MTDIGQFLMEFGDFLIYFGIGWLLCCDVGSAGSVVDSLVYTLNGR